MVADKIQEINYFENITSFRISEAVDRCLKHSRLSNFLGGTPFLWAIIKTVFTHPYQNICFPINDGPEEEVYSSLNLLANDRYIGRAIHVVREKELDDGLLDVLIRKENFVASIKIYKRDIFEDSRNIF